MDEDHEEEEAIHRSWVAAGSGSQGRQRKIHQVEAQGRRGEVGVSRTWVPMETLAEWEMR